MSKIADMVISDPDKVHLLCDYLNDQPCQNVKKITQLSKKYAFPLKEAIEALTTFAEAAAKQPVYQESSNNPRDPQPSRSMG